MIKALLLIKKLITYSIGSGRIFKGMIFIPLGIYLAKKNIKRIYSILLITLGITMDLSMASEVAKNYSIIITAIGVFGIVINIRLNDSGIYLLFRYLSTSIYFIHMYVWTFYYKITYGVKTFGMDSFLFTSIAALIISYIYIRYKKYCSCCIKCQK